MDAGEHGNMKTKRTERVMSFKHNQGRRWRQNASSGSAMEKFLVTLAGADSRG